VWPRESHSSVWVSESPLLALFLLHTYPVRSTTDSAGSKPNPAFVDLSWRGQGCALDSCDTVKSDCFTEDKSVLCPCVVGRGGGDPGDLLTLVFLWGGKLAQLTRQVQILIWNRVYLVWRRVSRFLSPIKVDLHS
jgi:hypothetical protein